MRRRCRRAGSPTRPSGINPTGKFVIGGPDGDAGLTGRKIIVDTYGGAAPHGGGVLRQGHHQGGSLGGLRSALCCQERRRSRSRRLLHLAARLRIGVAPLSIYIDTHGTGKVSDDKIEKAVAESMDLTPRGIRKHLDLNKPIYARTSAYGHFGRTPDADGGFSWEEDRSRRR
jgi:S-adenosylmethionine synthetase